MLAIVFATASSFAVHNGDKTSWALVQPGSRVTMSGNTEDVQRVQARFKAPFFWFRQGGKEYVVTDKGVIDRIVELSRPQEDLGRQQGKLGEQQSRLGREQSRLGRMQARDPGNPDVSRQQAQIGREQSRIGRLQSDLGRKQAELAEKMDEEVAAIAEQALRDGRANPL